MKITNKSTKIIGIAGVSILPDECVTVSDEAATSSIVKHFVSIGKISISDGAAPKGAASVVEEAPASSEEHGGDDEGSTDEKKTPLSRMNKGELVKECERLGIEVSPDDTNPDLVEKIKAATAE